MPTNERKLLAELNSMKMDKSDPTLDPWDPYNCPNCRSGAMPYPPEIIADVVNVEL